jgi:phytoene/squalene synthetase
MTLAACAALVERGDPDRFLSAMAAPVAARRVLFPLYAFNLEVARAPWVTAEPMIAEMRLQWWRDAIDEIVAGRPPRAHEVVAPLAGLIGDAALPAGLFGQIIDARRWDVDPTPFAAEEDVIAHIDRGAGSLMILAALGLGAPLSQQEALREAAIAGGIANWLRAVPALEAAGRKPLAHATLAEVRNLAEYGLGMLARHARTEFGAAVPALRAGWRAKHLLQRALADPQAVPDGRLGSSEFRRRGSLLVKSLTGRW